MPGGEDLTITENIGAIGEKHGSRLLDFTHGDHFTISLFFSNVPFDSRTKIREEVNQAIPKDIDCSVIFGTDLNAR